jgi:hypothetical protein
VSVRVRPESSALSPRQSRAIAALLTERSIAAAARRVRVDERTVRRWLSEDAAFRESYRREADAVLARVRATAKASAAEALEGLRELAAPDSKPEVRLGACRALLDCALKIADLDIITRVEALEAALATRPRRAA